MAKNNLLRFKMCNCPQEYWEEIVVDHDENFNDRSVIYFHCDFCGEDFAIIDFYTGEILYPKQNEENKSKASTLKKW